MIIKLCSCIKNCVFPHVLIPPMFKKCNTIINMKKKNQQVDDCSLSLDMYLKTVVSPGKRSSLVLELV